MADLAAPRRKRRVSPFWAKQLHLWHWMSSAICLIGMVLFAITGITLNHAADIAAEPRISTRDAVLPKSLSVRLPALPTEGDQPLPQDLAQWAGDALNADVAARPAEWSDREIYVSLPRPGGDGWMTIDRASGAAHYERTDRGWIALLNDLHKGRDTGAAWRWFIDIFAVACVIFSATGFLLLWLHARHRKSTWPLVGAGLVLPLLILILFTHV